jgi:hypothetical protein
VATALAAPAVLRGADSPLLPGRPMTLSALPAASAAAYRWRQVDGPPLVMSADAGLQTTISLPAGPEGTAGDVSTAVFELAVESDTGAVDRVRRTITVVPSADRTTLLQVQAGPGAGPGRDLLVQAPAFGYWRPEYSALAVNLSAATDSGALRVELWFFVSPGQPLVPGTYTIVPSRPGVPRSGPDITSEWNWERCTSGMSGSYTIHEVVVAAERLFDGFPLQRAAIDFDISCQGGPPLAGSLRFFSGVPLRAVPGGP